MLFNFIKNILPKKLNLLGVFLILCFLLTEFLISPVPVIASKTSIINRHIALNGVEVWPVNIIFMCQQYFDSPPLGGYPTCEQGITANNNFTVALGHNKIDNGNLAFWQMAMPKYTAAGKWFSTMTEGGNGGSSLLSNSLFINNVKNQPYFYGYELENEERSLWGQTDEALINRYNYYHSGDPNHIVYYFDFAYTGTGGHNVSEFSDVWGFSTFIHHTQPYFPVEDFIFARESQIIERPPFFTRLDDKPVPIMLTMEQVGQPINVCGGTCLPLTKKELRAHAYWGVTTNVAGLNFWSYKGAEDPHVSSSIYGTVSNPTTVKEMNDLAGDLTNSWMQHVLVSPTLNYSWNEEAPDNRVTFSKTACKFLSAYSGKCRSSFSYILKQYNGEYILIVPNKNKNQIANVQITIKGLTGDMTATTYSTYNTEDSSNNGRSIPVHDGVFTDTFDGYSAHVYRICSGTCPVGTPPPPPPSYSPPPPAPSPSVPLPANVTQFVYIGLGYGYFEAANGIHGGANCGSNGYDGIKGTFTPLSACEAAYGTGSTVGSTLGTYHTDHPGSRNHTICDASIDSDFLTKIQCILPPPTPTPTPTPTPLPPAPPCAKWKDGTPDSGVCLEVATSIFQGDTKSGNISTDPGKFIIRILTIILGAAGGIALLLIISSGYKIILSKGKPEGIQQGKEQLIAALVGLVFIIFSFVIFQFVIVDILKIPGIAK